MEDQRILVVVLEYHPEQKRVITRGVWPSENVPTLPLLYADNIQQRVKCFEGVESGLIGVGFRGLVPV